MATKKRKPGRPRGSTVSNPRSVFIKVWVRPDEKAEVLANASASGQTLPDYLRGLLGL